MTGEKHHPESEVMLTGLTGGNLLAFLAALGTFRILSLALPSGHIRMSWRLDGGAWRPVIHAAAALTAPMLTDSLASYLELLRTQSVTHPVRLWQNWLSDRSSQRKFFFTVCSCDSISSREQADWLTGIGTEINLAEGEDWDSALRAPRADYFGGNIESIIARNERCHIDAALFRIWTYSDPMDNLSLKFDASEDRRHALQWAAPSGDPERKKRGNVLGANRLALEAIPLFTTCVDGTRLATSGFTKIKSGRELTWGLWESPISLDTVRSLVALPEILREPPDTAKLKQIGLSAVYRCRRETIGKTRIFTRAFPK